MLSTDYIRQEIARQIELYAEGEFESFFKYCGDDDAPVWKVLEILAGGELA